MKKLIMLGVGLMVLGVSSMAFAEQPVCSATTSKGTVCKIGDKSYKSCGDGTFLFPAGSPTSACDAAWSQRYDGNGNPIPLKKEAVKTKSEATPQ